MIEFNSAGVQQWISKLEAAVDGDIAKEIFRHAGELVGIRAEELVGSYPAPFQTLAFRNRRYTWSNGTQSKFKSRRQQRKIFAMIKEGKIPSVRTGALGRAIRSEVQIHLPLVKVIVGTTANVESYASYVIGLPEEQALVHRDVWTPLQTTLESNVDGLENIFIQEVQRAYSRL